ncbi:MAG: outer membrane protein assembly factor BamE, partial [Gammaproteobacteria bacterium]|nr:outer membrane protein assembly factor BamE [Gammaproteobacteria bacterium]
SSADHSNGGTKGMTRVKLIVMNKVVVTALLLMAMALSSGCVYRSAIAQGNLVEQKDIDQIEVGMTRNQIRFLLGTPMIDDPFHKDRWDYIYYLKVGREDATFKRWLSIFFEDDTVSEVRKDQELSPDL